MANPVEKTVLQFVNESSTLVNYGRLLRSLYGDVPAIEVWYWQDNKFVVAGVFTDIRFELSETGYENFHAPVHPGAPPAPAPVVSKIKVNHGGPSTGIIKIG